MVGGGDVAGFADSYPYGFVALEAHQKELVVTGPEEPGQAAEDAVHVHVPLGPHELAHHGQEVHHHLVLTVAQRIVLEEVQAHGKPVFQVVDAEHLVDGLVKDGGEGGERGGEQLVGGGLLGLGDQSLDPVASQSGEAGRYRAAVGQLRLVGHGPLGDRQPFGHPAVSQDQQRAVELCKGRPDLAPLRRRPY